MTRIDTDTAPEKEPEPAHSPGRRRLLECMVWAGTGVLWTVVGGVPRSRMLTMPAEAATAAQRSFSFVQISDSHIGFHGPANLDVAGTLRRAIGEVKAAAKNAAFMIHTGDVSHTSKDAQFDTALQINREAGLETYYVPGEHDILAENGKNFFSRFGTGKGRWYNFDAAGVHFIGLDNVSDIGPGGLGHIGAEQLAWLKKDLAGRSTSQPIVVMAHMPLWQIYPKWGWGTDEAAEVMALLRPFGSATVLNGHIHQIVQKVEGQVAFHTARSTAFPQEVPAAPPAHPGPFKVADGRLQQMLGTADISYVPGTARLAIIDSPLGA
ncbi:MAG: metallophosphoesterase family protein [Acetobacteraceae bacterium]